ncbi:MAG TPA: hypothetical protein PLO41_02880 [Rubrivivax sp.]|nr:hypothetical protein [Rubrivivax sp.]
MSTAHNHAPALLADAAAKRYPAALPARHTTMQIASTPCAQALADTGDPASVHGPSSAKADARG